MYKVFISVFLCLTVWLKREAVWSFCELQYERSDQAQMLAYPQLDFLSFLFVALVYRDINLTSDSHLRKKYFICLMKAL